MNGPRRPIEFDADPEGWAEACIGAVQMLRRQRQSIVQTVPDQSAWAESDAGVDALLGLVALAGAFESIVEALARTAPVDAPLPSPARPAMEDLLR